MNDADSCRCDDMAARILRFCEAHDVKIVAGGVVDRRAAGRCVRARAGRIPRVSRVGGHLRHSCQGVDSGGRPRFVGTRRGRASRSGPTDGGVGRRAVRAAEYADRVIGLSTTGVAGPGPDGDKPAGLVYVGVRIPAAISPDGVPSVTAHELHLTGGREEVRRGAVFSLVQIVSHFTGDMQE